MFAVLNKLADITNLLNIPNAWNFNRHMQGNRMSNSGFCLAFGVITPIHYRSEPELPASNTAFSSDSLEWRGHQRLSNCSQEGGNQVQIVGSQQIPIKHDNIYREPVATFLYRGCTWWKNRRSIFFTLDIGVSCWNMEIKPNSPIQFIPVKLNELVWHGWSANLWCLYCMMAFFKAGGQKSTCWHVKVRDGVEQNH